MVLVLRYFKVRIQKLSILYILSNLVRIVKIRDTRFDEWILIPYPSGFSKDNSFCFGIQTETQNDAIDILKLNFDKTHYLVHQLTKDLTFSFDLCFIKI